MCYTARALETLLSAWVSCRRPAGTKQVGPHRAAGCFSPSPQKAFRLIVRIIAIGTVLGTALSAGLPCARAQILSYVDQHGRRIYVNSEDQELRQAAARGGASAALQLIERRKRALPGIERHIESEADRHGIDPQLVHAIIEVESAWNPRARSRKGALGLMQLLPRTAARFGVTELFDPAQNVTAGIRYLRFLLDLFDNNLEFAVAGYNAGENAVAAAGGVPPYRETRQYLARLRTLYGKLGPGLVGGGSIYPVVDHRGRLVYINE